MIGNITKHFTAITLERSTPSTDSWNNPIESWATVATIQGCIRQTSADHIFVSAIQNTNPKYRLYCMPCDIRKDDRVYFDGHYFKINKVNDVMHFGRLYQCECDLYE
jgi:head-tail adaptor